MKKLIPFIALVFFLTSCGPMSGHKANTSALDEQDHTEQNQRTLNSVQPPPTITWSLERDNLIKRFKLQNDRAVSFFMYVFIEGVATPIGYYQVNKVSSVNSQLTNPEQIVTYTSPNHSDGYGQHVIPSPAEDGSYGTNGDGVFGFTPEEIYIETNMKYITSTVPLHFNTPVAKLAVISTDEAATMLEVSKKAMNK
jgi:hypothetical protein